MTYRWPTAGELGSYYDIWLKMAIAWVVLTEYFEEEEWYLELEREARMHSTAADGVVDMVAFVECIYVGLIVYDWNLHRILGSCMLLF